MQRYIVIPATDDRMYLQVTEAASGPLVYAAARRNTRGAVSHVLTHAVNYFFPFFPQVSSRTRKFEVVEKKEQILEQRQTMRLFRVLRGLLGLSSKPVTVLKLKFVQVSLIRGTFFS